MKQNKIKKFVSILSNNNRKILKNILKKCSKKKDEAHSPPRDYRKKDFTKITGRLTKPTPKQFVLYLIKKN